MQRLFVFYFALHSFFMFGQEEDSLIPKARYHYGFTNAFNYSFNTPYFANSLTLQNSKKQFSIGHVLLLRGNGWKSGGVQFEYQYFPKTCKNRFNLYLFSSSNFVFAKKKSFYPVYNYNQSPSLVEIVSHVQVENYLNSLVGYGIRINFSKWCCLYQHNGLGFSFFGNKDKLSYQIHPENNRNEINKIGGNLPKLTYLFSFGLGFLF